MFKILTSGCEPTRGSEFSACVDVYASEDVTIEAGATKLIGLGICIDESYIFENIIDKSIASLGLTDQEIVEFNRVDEFKKSHYLQLMLRSSLGKKGLILPNGVGVIDLDYKDEIKMIIHNPIAYIFNEENEDLSLKTYSYSDREDLIIESFEIKKGDRIGQITLLEHKSFLFGIETTATRTGGFGSTN